MSPPLKQRIAAILWPAGDRFPDRLEHWRTVCVLLVIPLTAMLHHLMNQHRCILETFGNDYNLSSLRQLLLRDPSLPWAIAAMVLVYHLGLRSNFIRRAAAPAFAAFLPLSVWLWDIPFTGRVICHHLHDRHMMLAPGIA